MRVVMVVVGSTCEASLSVLIFPAEKETDRKSIASFFLRYERVRQRSKLQVLFSLSPSTTLKLISSLICKSQRQKRVSERTTRERMRMQGERSILYILFFSSMTSSFSFRCFLLHSLIPLTIQYSRSVTF